MVDAIRTRYRHTMDEIFRAMIDLVGWINEEYGPWAGWGAALLTLLGFVGVIVLMITWVAR